VAVRPSTPASRGSSRTTRSSPKIAGDLGPSFEIPLRLFGGVHYLALAGSASFSAFREALAEHRDWLARWVAEQPVQTNEVQRSWALLPAFLTLAGGRPLDLIELGPSAGLNLLWDRYRYQYRAAAWGPGDAELVLSGEERGEVPSGLLATEVQVVRRCGIDRRPLDVTSEPDRRLLEAFVWADQPARRERLQRALAVAAEDPPELIAGDYVELLPRLLDERDEATLTVVFQTASTAYLPDKSYARLRGALDSAGARGPLAFLSTRRLAEEEEEQDGYGLELRLWPGGEARVVERFGHHGQWLRWHG
jgi:hypothetical protein